MAFDEKWDDYSLIEIRGDGVPVDITFDPLTMPDVISNYTIRFYGKRQPTDSNTSAIFKLSSADATPGVIITDVPGKVAQAKVPASATLGLTAKTVVYCEWEVQKAGEDPHTVDGGRGKITFLPDVVSAN